MPPDVRKAAEERRVVLQKMMKRSAGDPNVNPYGPLGTLTSFIMEMTVREEAAIADALKTEDPMKQLEYMLISIACQAANQTLAKVAIDITFGRIPKP